MTGSGELLIRPSAADDAVQLAELFLRAFGTETSPAHWLWKYFGDSVRATGFVAELDGRIVAHFGGQLFPARYHGAAAYLSAVTDLMTDPSVRGMIRSKAPLSILAEKYFHETARLGVAFLFGFPGRASRLYGERFLGYRSVGPVPEYSWMARGGVPPSSIGSMRPLGMPRHFSAGVERDEAYLQWRYRARPGVHYHFAEKDDAIAVFRFHNGVIQVLDCGWRSLKSLADLLMSLESGTGSGGGRAVAWFPLRLARKLKGVMEIDERATDKVLSYRPILSGPGARYIRERFFFSWGDYDVP